MQPAMRTSSTASLVNTEWLLGNDFEDLEPDAEHHAMHGRAAVGGLAGGGGAHEAASLLPAADPLQLQAGSTGHARGPSALDPATAAQQEQQAQQVAAMLQQALARLVAGESSGSGTTPRARQLLVKDVAMRAACDATQPYMQRCFNPDGFSQLVRGEPALFITREDKPKDRVANPSGWSAHSALPLTELANPRGEPWCVLAQQVSLRCETSHGRQAAPHAYSKEKCGSGGEVREVWRYMVAYAEGTPAHILPSYIVPGRTPSSTYSLKSRQKTMYRFYFDHVPSVWWVSPKKPAPAPRAPKPDAKDGPGAKRARSGAHDADAEAAAAGGSGAAGPRDMDADTAGGAAMLPLGADAQAPWPTTIGIMGMPSASPGDPIGSAIAATAATTAVGVVPAGGGGLGTTTAPLPAADPAAGDGGLAASHPHAAQLAAAAAAAAAQAAVALIVGGLQCSEGAAVDPSGQAHAPMQLDPPSDAAMPAAGSGQQAQAQAQAAGAGGGGGDGDAADEWWEAGELQRSAEAVLWRALAAGCSLNAWRAVLQRLEPSSILDAHQPGSGESVLHALCTPAGLLRWRHGNCPPGQNSEPPDAHAEEARVIALMQALHARVGQDRWLALLQGPSARAWTHASPLHKAARYGHRTAVLRHLLRYTGRLSIISASNHGWLAYHTAARSGHQAAVREILLRLRELYGAEDFEPHGHPVLYQLANKHFVDNGGAAMLQEVCDELGISQHLLPAGPERNKAEIVSQLAQLEVHLRMEAMHV